MSETEKGSVQLNESPLPGPAHTIEGDKVVQAFETDAKLGLSADKITALQEKYGPNRLKPPPKPSLFKIFVRNFLVRPSNVPLVTHTY